MPNIAFNTLVFNSDDDRKTVQQYMSRYAPQDGIYRVKDIKSDVVVLENIASNADGSKLYSRVEHPSHIRIDDSNGLRNEFVKFSDVDVKVGDYLWDNRVDDESNHYKVIHPDFDTPKFNFNLLIPTADEVINYIVVNDKLRQPHDDKRLWFDWNNAHWGTEWNAFNVIYHDDVIEFETAWDNVYDVIEKLSEHFPDIHFTYGVEYEDEGYDEWDF